MMPHPHIIESPPSPTHLGPRMEESLNRVPNALSPQQSEQMARLLPWTRREVKGGRGERPCTPLRRASRVEGSVACRQASQPVYVLLLQRLEPSLSVVCSLHAPFAAAAVAAASRRCSPCLYSHSSRPSFLPSLSSPPFCARPRLPFPSICPVA